MGSWYVEDFAVFLPHYRYKFDITGIFVEKPLMYLIAIFFPAATPPLVLEKNVEHLTERQGTFFMLILGKILSKSTRILIIGAVELY